MATCCFAMCVPLQTRWRSFRVRRQLDHRQSAVAFIHALWRGCSQRRRYRRHIQDITLLQALCRGYLQRRRYKEMVSEKSRQEALEREEEHKWRHDNSDGVQKAEEEEKGGRRQNEVGQGEAEVMPAKENPGESLESKEKLTEYKEMVSEKSRQEALEREEEHKWRHDNSDGVQKAEEEEKGGRRQNEVGQGEAEVMPAKENPGESLESKEKLTE
ncbi:uncharacterized protein LOC142486294 [Ascaphus truei]|uniref:uncharacterized protein LOC142486294 n=1 Tax=Ascaphus truei TaxID=8439 RepID=UPI003F5A3BD6